MRALYTATLFVSSFLLFLVQPLAGKIILPAFGGAPAVWSATLVFFQAVLLLGYGYAHLSISKLGTKRQPFLHLAFLAVALVTLPFTVRNPVFLAVQDRLAGSGSSNPAPLVLLALAGLVGLPFFVVSAGAPLLQRWFATTSDPRAKDPYFLYAASNVGSMLALLAYPIFIEPRMTIAEQSKLWLGLYLLLLVGMVFCAIIAIKGPVAQADTPVVEVEGMAVDPTPQTPRAPFSRWRTILLGAVPSSLLTGVTTFVTTNVAPIPLLWIVPLALYLLTFILAFASRPLLSATTLSRILPMVLTPLLVVTLMEAAAPGVAILHLLGFFVAAWMCHARLNEERPEPARLTEFYFYMSLGGVIGGAFNGLLAPSVFNTLLEYPIALVVVGGLKLPYVKGSRFEWKDIYFGLGLLAAACALIWVVAFWLPNFSWYHPLIPTARTAVTLGIPAVMAFVASDRPWRYAACLAAVVGASYITGINQYGQNVFMTERSFFGEHRVAALGPFHRLVHGNTLHGMQDTRNPGRPLTYYYPTGPIGQVFDKMKDGLKDKHVGLVGLGVGSLAAYGQPGQRMTFFEIDPLVLKIARDSGQFTFLKDSKAEVDVVLGDARLTLARQPDGEFSLLAIDAFSSDAIPVHLLTQQAMALYMRKLTPNGVLAVHLSNRYLDLNPVVAAEAKALGLVCYDQLDAPGTGSEEEENGKTQSDWMILARKKEDLAPMIGGRGVYWSEAEAGDTRPWTDDYSNVLGAFSMDK